MTYSYLSKHTFAPNLKGKSKAFNVTMVVSLIMVIFISFVKTMGWHFVFLVLTLHHKMEKQKGKLRQLIILLELCFPMPPCHLLFGIMPLPSTYLHNVLPTKILAYRTPTHILYQKNSSYSHLRVFGCLWFPLFPSTPIHKVQSRSSPYVFLGYPSNHRGYKWYDFSSHKIIMARHVCFDETNFPFSKLHNPSPTSYDFLGEDVSPFHIHMLHQLANSNGNTGHHDQPCQQRASILYSPVATHIHFF